MTEHKPLSLKVPEPSTRPGDKPDFSYIDLPAAGTTRRPEVDCAADSMRDLAFDLVTVLDDSGQAMGPWAMDLDDKLLLKGLHAMEKTRAFDERMQMAQRQGKTSIYVQCRGEEAIACGLRPVPEIQFADYILPAYDQIASEAARLRYRSSGEFSAPITVRAPCGGGIFGGQTHSQSPEALFTHVAGLKTVMEP